MTRPSDLLLPLLVLVLTNFFAFISSFFAKRFFDVREASLIAFCSAVPNTGFFGIPLVAALLGERALVHQILLAYIGVGITCYTSALFFLSSGSFDMRTSLLALLKMPFLYALSLGGAFAFLGFPTPPLLLTVYSLAKSTFVVVAMVIMGGMINRFSVQYINWPLLRAVLGIRYLAWPAVIGAILLLDSVAHFLILEVRVVLACNAFVPVALNSVNLSLVMGIDSREAENLVVISTILSFLLVPMVVLIF